MDYNKIKSYFTIKQDHGDKCKAVCPAHDDKQASLSITYSKSKGSTGLKCFAGCEVEDICNAVGIKVSNLFDEELKNSSSGKKSDIEAIYDYLDENGNVLFQKVRFKPKRFSQKRIVNGVTVWGLDAGIYWETFDGSNEYSKNKKDGARSKEFDGLNPILYNLPRLIKAQTTGETVFIVEGEKDVSNLTKLGFIATCNFDGASANGKKPKWKDEYNSYFKGLNVVLIPDNDGPGRAHASYIAESLNHMANSIRILELPELEEKGDVSDWLLTLGHSREELIDLVKAAENWEVCTKRWNKSVLKFNFSDVGNAERLVHMYGDNIRFNTTRNKWLVWSGKYWQFDDLGKVERLAKHVIRKLQQEGFSIDASVSEEDAALKKQVLSFVLKSESDSRIKAMINQARSQVGISVHESSTDKDIYSLNVKNGTLDLRTGKLSKHNRKDFITKIINIDYKENAQCPNWVSFLDRIFLGDKELIEYIQKTIGYSLTGAITEQSFYMLYGNGANGKSTFLNTIQRILGEYADTLKGSSLMVKRNDDGARGDLAKLKGKRFVISSELNEGQTFDESLLKALTGGDTVPVRFMYAEEFPLQAQFKLWIMTNEKPKIKGTNHGIWRRVRLIPFLYKFKDEEKDENFFEKFLEPELPGILNWAIQGCLIWLKDGIETPEKVKAAVDEYKTEMDTIQRFIDDCCVVADNCTAKITDLYELYMNWCKENNEYELSNIKFTKKIKEKGFDQDRNRYTRFWKGLGIAAGEEMVEVKDNVFPFQTTMNY